MPGLRAVLPFIVSNNRFLKHEKCFNAILRKRGLIVKMQTNLNYVKKMCTRRIGREKAELEGNMLKC